MLTTRLRARVGRAEALGAARLPGRRLVFDKLGQDGSAKANLAVDPAAAVWGVVWELEAAALLVLDRVEGGYERVAVEVVTAAGVPLAAQTYVSQRLAPDPTPLEGYRRLLVEGARLHGLPAEYVAWLEGHAARPDPR